MANSAYKLDANESAFFKRELEYIKSKTYDEIGPVLKYMEVFPITSEAPAGATQITYRKFKTFGMAKIIADYATDFPRVDVGGEEVSVKIKDIGAMYAYTIAEIRKSALAGENLPARKATAVRDVINQKLNKLAFSGDTTNNIQGFINYPGILEYTVPATGTGTTKTWSTKTADQILTDLNGIVTTIINATSGVEYPDTILMPIDQFRLISTTRVGTASDTTILQFFLQNNPGITVNWLKELDGAGAGSTDQMVAYKKSPDKLTFEVPIAFEQGEENLVGREYQVPCMANCAGVLIFYPYSVCKADGI